MKNRKIVYVLLILTVLFTLIGGTFAYLNFTFEATNSNYASETHCFQIDYTINNENSGQDITGTLFPSANPTGGLNGRVGLKTNNNCELNGIGTLKLHINDSIDSTSFTKLTTKASSYCRSRKTGEAVNLSESECTEAGNRWIDIPTSYCENTNTLEYMKDYTTSSDCTSNGGTWVTNGSPLKYAVYNSVDLTTPVSVGHIISTDRGTDMTIFDNFIVSNFQKYYYVYIWLDGYLTDNTFDELPFSGHIESNVIQDNQTGKYTFVNYIQSSGTQFIDSGVIIDDANYEVDIVYEYISVTTNSLETIAGCAPQTGGATRFYPISPNSETNPRYVYGTYDFSRSNWLATNKHVLIFNNPNHQIIEDNTIIGTADTSKLTPPNVSLGIFAIKFTSSWAYHSKAKLYSLQIKHNNELLRDFIPAYRKSDNVVGLFDTVNGEFYFNAATTGNDFTYG